LELLGNIVYNDGKPQEEDDYNKLVVKILLKGISDPMKHQ
jgi:hypothetical protein